MKVASMIDEHDMDPPKESFTERRGCPPMFTFLLTCVLLTAPGNLKGVDA